MGKSTFFNYLVGSRISIVQDTPGVTRDRIYAETNWRGRDFTLIDTGGIEPDSEDIILEKRNKSNKLTGISVINGNTLLLLCVDAGYRNQGIGTEK